MEGTKNAQLKPLIKSVCKAKIHVVHVRILHGGIPSQN